MDLINNNLDVFAQLRNRLRSRYILAPLLIFALATSSFLLIDDVLDEQEFDARTINKAGQQRMLSQRLALTVNAYKRLKLSGADTMALRNEIKAAASLMMKNHLELTLGPDNLGTDLSPRLRELYFSGAKSLDSRVRTYVDSALEVADLSTLALQQEDYFFSIAYSNALLIDLDRVVQQFETEAKSRVDLLARFETIIWIITVLVLMIEVFFIFKPMEKLIGRKFSELDDQKNRARELQKIAEDAAKIKSEFLSNMSHEIRTPMNGIIGMLGLLAKEKLTEQQKHRTDVAQSSARSLLTIINNILDFSKIDSNIVDIESVEFNFERLIGQLVQSQTLEAEKKSIELSLNTAKLSHKSIASDPSRIRQILGNLICNAIKFTEQGEVNINVSSETLENNKIKITMSVQDTGVGINNDSLPTIFEAFVQADNSTTRKHGGTGLGLAIAYRLCNCMGGELRAESKPSAGSVFTAQIIAEKAKHSLLEVPSIDLSKLNILIVDDNDTNREILREQLKVWGAKTAEAANSYEAISLCEQRHSSSEDFFDIALLDMQMPVMDGAELGQKLKADARFKSIKLIMMTSLNAYGDASRMAALGFSAYFSKPSTTDDLYTALNIVGEGGESLKNAHPLVTKEYLESIKENAIESKASQEEWPTNTRILVVEDNQINQQVALGILEDFGLSAETADDGIIALETIRQSKDDPYTIVLMDCQMPNLNGYDTTRAIRNGKVGEHCQDVVIVAMTANAMKGDREKCLDSGMNDYLSKPIDTEFLYEKLKFWLCGEKIDNRENLEIDNTKVTWAKHLLSKRLKGRENVIQKLTKMFESDYKIDHDDLVRLRKEKDWDGLYEKVHTLCGVAANLAAQKLEENCLNCMQLIKSTDYADANNEAKSLIKELEAFYLTIRNYNQSTPNEGAIH